jgi:hypothetical protein
MIPASLDRSLDDRRLSPFKVRILALLHRFLVYHEFREVKLYQLAYRLGMDGRKGKGTISKVLRDLTRCGYLARGPNRGTRGREVGTYMLLMGPPRVGARLEEWPEDYQRKVEGCRPATLLPP